MNGARLMSWEHEKMKVWVRAGGRCTLCNRYVLEDERSLVSIGEAAHIVGRHKTAGSPRGTDPLPLDERNKAENLMLLCANEHKAIDDKERCVELDVAWLREQKRRHEERIHHVTGLGYDRQTAVIRMLGNIRGAPVEIRAEHAQRVVREQSDRMAYFPFVMGHDGIEIDLCAVPEPEEWDDAYWVAARRIIDARLMAILDGAARGEVRHLSVFGLARIPLLVYLGYRLGDKVPLDIYQKHRGGDESWKWSDEAPVQFAATRLRHSDDSTRVALILSLSGTIPVADLPHEIADTYNIFEISPCEVGVKPSRDVLRARESLETFQRCFHDFLSTLEVEHKGAQSICIFPAVPVAAAIACGRGVMRAAQPSLAIYDRSPSGFRFALEVNRS